MSAIRELAARCQCGVFITVNEHRNYYQTAEEFLADREQGECPPKIEPEIRTRMVATDTVVEVQFCVNTPVSSFVLYHYDVDAAVEQALQIARTERWVDAAQKA